jgi:hypothetical protein
VLRAFDGSANARNLDLNELVPRSGRLNYVWYVRPGRTVPQVAVAWQFRDARGNGEAWISVCGTQRAKPNRCFSGLQTVSA